MPKHKDLTQGSRFSFYFAKDFPQELLDWLNSQSDRNLVFTYALDLLYQHIGNRNLAEILPRNYEPLQHNEVAAAIPTVTRPSNVPGTSVAPPKSVQEEFIAPVEADRVETYEPTPPPPVEPTVHPKPKKKWGQIESLDGDPYA